MEEKNMKRVFVFVLALLLIMCLSGCIRYNTTLDIKPNGKADITMIFAYSISADEEPDMDEDTLADMVKEGWKYKEYSEDNFKGYILTKENVDILDLKKSLHGTYMDMDHTTANFEITKDGSKYTLDWKVFDGDQSSEIISIKEMLKMSDGYMTFVIKLPTKPINSNATNVSDDGKTLTWDLTSLDSTQTIHVEFRLLNMSLIIGLIAGGLVLIAVIALIIVLIVKNKKMKAVPNMQYQPYNNYYQNNMGYGQPNGMPMQGNYVPNTQVPYSNNQYGNISQAPVQGQQFPQDPNNIPPQENG